MGFGKVQFARNELIRAALTCVSGDMYDDDFPERDASGGEASAVRDSDLAAAAESYVAAFKEDKE